VGKGRFLKTFWYMTFTKFCGRKYLRKILQFCNGTGNKDNAVSLPRPSCSVNTASLIKLQTANFDLMIEKTLIKLQTEKKKHGTYRR